jgi:hypothetical protein
MVRVEKLVALLIVGLLPLSLVGPASAMTINLVGASSDAVQNTSANPCIISGTNCATQPSTLDYTTYANGGISSIDVDSPEYTVAELQALLGSNNFSVGLDVNQDKSAQTLDSFSMLVNGAPVASYTYSGTGNVPAGNNGNGYADWLLTGFSLTLLSATDIISFNVQMSDLSDGAEKFFLVSAVPLPSSILMFLSAFGALGFLWYRRSLSGAAGA